MDNANMTMVGIPWGSSHRTMKIEKVDNGYIVKATFREKRKSTDPVSLKEETHYSTKEKTYVFYTVAEVVMFTRSYLEAEASDLRKDKGDD